jgi:hypothetical protein
MTREEYNILFHKEQLNLVAFKRLMDCDEEVLRLVKKAIEQEREECAKACEEVIFKVKPIYCVVAENCVKVIRARGQE